MVPECLCITDEGLCSGERNGDIYAFIFWVGRVFRVLVCTFGVMMFLF